MKQVFLQQCTPVIKIFCSLKNLGVIYEKLVSSNKNKCFKWHVYCKLFYYNKTCFCNDRLFFLKGQNNHKTLVR